MDDKRVENSVIFVTRSIKKDGREESSEDDDIISVHKFRTEPAHVQVDYSLTINLGNFESARVGVSVRVPCYAEEIDDAYAYAQSWVAKRVGEERDLIQGAKSDSNTRF